MTALAWLAVGLYVVLLLAMLAYGANSFLMVALHWRHRHRAVPAPATTEPLPRVTVQLPVYNEANVVSRLLRAVGELDWPRDLLEIQLLDDSDDATSEIAASEVQRLRDAGFAIEHIRRDDRAGFKAGALSLGLERSTGELLAIFDADFVPPPDFLRRCVGRFADPSVAAVQGRWTHLNRDHSGLTRAQALGIDGHFGVEQAARCWAGWFLNFNGTAGVWRRGAIADAGGWSGDTLTEDLDLSYRAQIRGWRIVYDSELVCPGELPMDLAAFKSQQRRWATGSMQVARKLLPAIWRSPASLAARLQATLHLTHYAVHPLIVLTALLSVPCVVWPGSTASPQSLWALLPPFALAMGGPMVLHIYAQWVLERRRLRLGDLGRLTLVGIGIAVSNGMAVLDAFVRRRELSFVRTPKRGDVESIGYRAQTDGLRHVEAGFALYCLFAGIALIWARVYVIAPFMLLDTAGFAFVALSHAHAVGPAAARGGPFGA